ncbi:MAG: NAD(P)(+) transhydrogenase (Re/Si-specific) subunit beta [Thermomicrobiales bacterium]|jgi:NAD(P) transhydrogenase subunit beta|nr:NAD(P)(+) transhydrogenase (Re/Si-specific) subunit beta [Thermomicrobiales bacterium]
MIDNWHDAIVDLAYLATAIMFIIGLKYLSTPKLARRGNQLATVGMIVAVLATLVSRELRVTENGQSETSWTNIGLILLALAVGALLSVVAAQRVKMTAMPQMVAIFCGVGGATVALTSVAEFMHKEDLGRGMIVLTLLGAVIGSIAFTGSMVAFGKLQELISGRPVTFPNQTMANGILFGGIAALGAAVVLLQDGSTAKLFVWILFIAALIFGAAIVLPIGGADMPVVIAILNSLTGVAAALAGLIMDNMAMVIAGALVGASGAYLTLLMAKAMNRSVTNILFGAFGGGGETASGGAGGEQKPVKEASVDDAAVALAYATNVIVVPGYGLAVAQAQHAVRELADELEERGVNVKYAIHPVAGRMPGHMNVLLAEANVPYEQLYDMEQINDEFAQADVALVIGANDVTNPAARTDKTSPIFGMPILNVDQARQIYVLKRSMKSGFAGIENELFHDQKTSMVFGDAKATLSAMVSAVKEN